MRTSAATATAAETKTDESAIPFNKPLILGSELEYVARAIRSGAISGDGPFTRRCARVLERRLGIAKVLMTPSCTAALEMAAMLCGLGPEDEVILPSYTFVSTANAIVRTGARPVFVDIRPDTLNLDETRIEEAITARTRAIFPVHYAGVACAMDEILETARDHGLLVVEDAAQGVNAWYRGRALGTMGHLGTYSFHDTKNLVCGEGGALCCNDPGLVERAEILRDKGTNRAQFFRGEVDKYTWIDVGSSCIPSEIACAFLAAQLEAMDAITTRRRAIDRYYRERLAPLEDDGLLQLPVVPEDCRSNHASFHILLGSEAVRDGLIAHLKQRGISAVFHFIPLHTAPMGLGYGYRKGDLPITEDLSGRLLRLPAFAEITEAQQARVVETLAAYLHHEPGVAAAAYSYRAALPLAVGTHA
jgi:dTDP-4-amino-4,6-dideoxygalactose transaminase